MAAPCAISRTDAPAHTALSTFAGCDSTTCNVPTVLGHTTATVCLPQVVATTIPPRSWMLNGTSQQVVRDWEEKSIDMLPGDIVTLNVSGGILGLEMPLTVPGVVVQPAAVPQASPLSSTRSHARRLPLGVASANSAGAQGAAASKRQGSRHTGGGLDPWSWSSGDGTRHALPGLRVMCLFNNTSAFTL